MNIDNLIISLVSGAIGGNAAGSALKEKSLGGLGNTVAGVLGGGIGGGILHALGVNDTSAAGSVDLASVLSNIAGGAAGGGALMAVIAAIKGTMGRKL